MLPLSVLNEVFSLWRRVSDEPAADSAHLAFSRRRSEVFTCAGCTCDTSLDLTEDMQEDDDAHVE